MDFTHQFFITEWFRNKIISAQILGLTRLFWCIFGRKHHYRNCFTGFDGFQNIQTIHIR